MKRKGVQRSKGRVGVWCGRAPPKRRQGAAARGLVVPREIRMRECDQGEKKGVWFCEVLGEMKAVV